MADATISLCYGEFIEPKTGKKTVQVEIANQGREPIKVNKIEWVYFYEKPVDATAEFLEKHGKAFEQATGQKPMKAEETGRRYTFGPVEGSTEGPLAPQESRTYFYPVEWMAGMLSIAQALSPERYWVEVTLNEHQMERLNGKTFGGFLERQFSSGE